jgi:hypothetical protein
MIKMQCKDIVKKGAAPGAVVTVQCDYHAVSHSIGIVSVIYEVSKFGSARIATIAGILSSGSKKGPWWIPSDQNALRYGANEDANITPQLRENDGFQPWHRDFYLGTEVTTTIVVNVGAVTNT